MGDADDYLASASPISADIFMTYFASLLPQIQDKTTRLVVIGVGYVGLPVATRFAEAGFHVTGLDVNKNQSRNRPGLLSPSKAKTGSGRVNLCSGASRAAQSQHTDYAVCQQAQVVIISVETPIDSIHQPRYLALRSALRTLNPNLRPGTLVIIESRLPPEPSNGSFYPSCGPMVVEEPGRSTSSLSIARNGSYFPKCWPLRKLTRNEPRCRGVHA